MSLAISDHLDTVPGAGGHWTLVQCSGVVGPGLQVLVLRSSDQQQRLSVPGLVLSNTEPEETVLILTTCLHHRSSGLEIELIRQPGQADQEDEDAAGDVHGDGGGGTVAHRTMVTPMSS